MKYLIDTGFLVALANTDDKFHKITIDKFNGILENDNFRLLLPEHVVTEFLSFIMYKVSKEEALSWGEEIFEHHRFEIIYSDENILHSAWIIYRDDLKKRKPLSFVDCIILASCQQVKPDELLSYDNRLNSIFKQFI